MSQTFVMPNFSKIKKEIILKKKNQSKYFDYSENKGIKTFSEILEYISMNS